MHSCSMTTRAVQYLTATIFTALALLIILQDAIGPDILARWTIQHSFAVLLVIGTTLAIESAVNAWADSRRALSAGFGTVATVGLLLIVLMSGGRQNEAQAERDRVALAHNAKIEAARTRLDDAVAAKAKIDADAVASAAERHCATHCRALLQSSQAAATIEVESARAALAAMPPLMAVGSTEGAFWSDTLSPWLPAPVVEHIAPKAKYLLLVAFAELGAAAAWLSVRRRRPAPVNTTPAPASTPAETPAPTVVPDAVETVAPTPTVDAPKTHVDEIATRSSAPARKPNKTSARTRRRAAKPTPSAPARWEPSAILSDMMLRAATGRSFENNTKAAEFYGYSRSRFSELQKQWKRDGALV